MSFAVTTVDGVSASGATTDRVRLAAALPTITVTGFLDGSITGAELSTVLARFDPLSRSSIPLGDGSFVQLSLPSEYRILVPSTTSGGRSSVEAFAFVQRVPEPGAVALFLVVGAGLGLRRLRRGRGVGGR